MISDAAQLHQHQELGSESSFAAGAEAYGARLSYALDHTI